MRATRLFTALTLLVHTHYLKLNYAERLCWARFLGVTGGPAPLTERITNVALRRLKQ